MRAARYYGKGDIRVEDVAEAQIREPDDVLDRALLLRHLRHRPARVRRRPDRHADHTAPADRRHPAADPRPRVLGAGRRGRRRRCGTCGSATASRSCRPSSAAGAGTAGAVRATSACSSPAPGLSAETGGLAELAVVKEYQVARLPDEVSDLEGAVVEPAAVAAYGVERAGVTGGDVVLITGAGPIGILQRDVRQRGRAPRR